MFFNDLYENEEGRLNGRKKVAPSLTPSSVTHYLEYDCTCRIAV